MKKFWKRNKAKKETGDISVAEVGKSENEVAEEKCDIIDDVVKCQKGGDNISVYDCFFCKEENMAKWAKGLVSIWHNLMFFLWIVFCCLTFSPIMFTADKFNAIFKNKKKSICISVILHVLLICLLALLLGVFYKS